MIGLRQQQYVDVVPGQAVDKGVHALRIVRAGYHGQAAADADCVPQRLVQCRDPQAVVVHFVPSRR